MTITIKWWAIVVFFLVLPFGYWMIRGSGNDYDLELDIVAIFIAGWCLAIGVLIGKLL